MKRMFVVILVGALAGGCIFRNHYRLGTSICLTQQGSEVDIGYKPGSLDPGTCAACYLVGIDPDTRKEKPGSREVAPLSDCENDGSGGSGGMGGSGGQGGTGGMGGK